MKEHIAACVQIAIKPNNIKENTDKVCHWMEKAAKEHEAELLLFPESITTGFTPNMPKEAFYELLPESVESHTTEVRKLCKELKVHLVYPIYERGSEKGEILNSSLLIDDQGQILGNYRKTHPFPTERQWTTAGTETAVIETKLGKIGMIICYDGDFPELSRVLTLKGAEIITRPSALLRSFDIWELTNKGRAYDNHVYLLGANAVGPDAGDNYYFGHSMIVSPIAQILGQARGTEEIVSAKLDPNPIKNVSYGTRSPMIFDHVEDRNVDAYKEILTEGTCAFEPAKRIPYQKK
ncbi:MULTISPECIES: carbon-nitrogen hydrolase family protein [Tindallia]|uniref:Predicted amidohydrolase n=2 Tax=Tindallia TaxID=69894 RepID=A0A1H3PT24_9FIRM|nr:MULTISPECIES: carbon-nitrogen hydrolase family protein [Tindallia]SDZ04091.1 Predicted amidohydrolase [Tindallia californiensis]SFI19284.1 Predicted amidohydrolase [Tindallia magadiensis]